MISSAFETTFRSISDRVHVGREAGLYGFGMAFESAQGATSRLDGREVTVLTSNNYLGLAADPRINASIVDALHTYGASTCGARLHNGTTDVHTRLEHSLAQWLDVEAVMIYSSGFLANLGAVSALGDENTVIITDQLNHMSIVDGQTLARAQVRIFAHNDMQKLEYILARTQDVAKRLIVTDGVFSMDGDLAPLDEIVALGQRYDALVMVDDAHALGVLGATGRGSGEHFGVRPDVIMGTFSKSLAGTGGYIGGPQSMIDYLRHSAHSYVFNASSSPALTAGVATALEIMKSESWRREKLWHNTIRFRSALIRAGFDVLDSVTPVVPIMIGDELTAMQMAKELLDVGVYIALAIFPAVPQGKGRFRATITSSLSDQQIDDSVAAIVEVASRHGLLQAVAA